MSYLEKLKAAKSLKDVAGLLGFTPSGLGYILYKVPNSAKYTAFEIPKRSGGKRQIKAPIPMLSLLQRRLANLLYDCLSEIEKDNPTRRSLAHGFERSRSIVTNASLHKRRRYVLNLDLEDFFPSINFGRVRGFFIKDQYFGLNEAVATIVAQIACHDNELPQGSPCSPVISNLVGHLLDTRLVRLASAHKCTYSRYADDLTFSTNQKGFPLALAVPAPHLSSGWELGAPLKDKIERSGFEINYKKTRMQCRGSRQVATGLLVNEKVNIRPEYWRTARAMCHSLFTSGSYHRVVAATLLGDKLGDPPTSVPCSDLSTLEGILSHIHQVKDYSDRRLNVEKKRKPLASRLLYAKFLFFKNFVALESPLILPEGKTDSIYLRAAIQKSPAYHPELGAFAGKRFKSAIRFMNYSRTVHDVMQIGGGAGDIKHLIIRYCDMVRRFKYAPLAHPVIILIDNDGGAKDIFSVINSNGWAKISHASTHDFYHLGANLYLIKTPEIGASYQSKIEDLFDSTLLNTILDGKTFDPEKEHGAAGKYGKVVFAERVVKPGIDKIDFSKFSDLLGRIVAALRHHYAKPASAAVA